MHPITGAFGDPERESAFATHFFRLAFPFHAFLMALLIPLTAWAAKGAPSELRPVWYTRSLLCSISLIGRVLTHRIEDPVRSQRVGAWCWTALVLLSCCVLDVYNFWRAPAISCGQASREVAAIPLIYLGAALTNGTHGLSFEYKAALLGLVLAVDIFAPVAACGSFLLLPLIFIMAAGVTGFVLAHMAELLWRHSISSTHAEMERLAEGQRSLEEKLGDETRRLEERNEQLRAEKERLLYDNALQRRGRHFDDNDDRSAIGRGLQAEPSQPYLPADDGTASMSESSESQASGPHRPSGSPPVSLPPGPPSTGTKSSRSSSGEEPPAASSTAGSTAGHPSALDKMVREALGTDNGTDSLLTEVLADNQDLDLQTFSELERMLLSATEGTTEGRPMAAVGRPVLDGRGPWLGQEPSQGSDLKDWFSSLPGSLPASGPFLLRPPPLMLSLLPTVAQQRVPLPAQTHSGVVVAVAQHPAVSSVSVAQMMAHQQGAVPHTKQEAVAVNSTLQEQGHTQQSLQSLASDLLAAGGPSCNVLLHAPPSTPGSLGGQSNMSTSQQQALHVARQAIRLARVDVEVYHVVRTLAIALGASRTEGGTIKALHAVLLQLERPELSCEEARGSTGASMSNFKKWQRRVHHARLNLPGEYRVNSDARTRELD